MANGNWQFNLFKAMNDPSLIVYRDRILVIIKDKYPKSSMHFLALPLDNIPNVASLRPCHIPMLQHMEQVTTQYIQNYPGRVFWWGFHAVPTMVQLHLHIISDDFRGTGLKTAKHWNSFTTSFFVPLSKVISDLHNLGRVNLPPMEVCQSMLKAPLACHKCAFRPSTMPMLKSHLDSH